MKSDLGIREISEADFRVTIFEIDDSHSSQFKHGTCFPFQDYFASDHGLARAPSTESKFRRMGARETPNLGPSGNPSNTPAAPRRLGRIFPSVGFRERIIRPTSGRPGVLGGFAREGHAADLPRSDAHSGLPVGSCNYGTSEFDPSSGTRDPLLRNSPLFSRYLETSAFKEAGTWNLTPLVSLTRT